MSSLTTAHSVALASLLFALPACELDPEWVDDSSQEISCSYLHCGKNTPIMGDKVLMDIAPQAARDQAGPPNQDDLMVVGVDDPNGRPATFQVDDDGYLEILDWGGTVTFTGANVVGTRFRVRDRSTDDMFEVSVVDFHESIKYWIGESVIPSYVFEYSINGGSGGRNLCPGPYDYHDSNFAGVGLDVILFGGERYDFDTREVIASGPAAGNWMNISCVGDARSKMIAYQHRPRAQPSDTYYTVPEQRQALLRMFGADYCGDGSSFTVHGQPLTWTDHNDWMQLDDEDRLEAVWGPDGVACINWPRLADTEPGIFADIIAQCPNIQPCRSGMDVNGTTVPLTDWDQHFYFQSWNPL